MCMVFQYHYNVPSLQLDLTTIDERHSPPFLLINCARDSKLDAGLHLIIIITHCLLTTKFLPVFHRILSLYSNQVCMCAH